MNWAEEASIEGPHNINSKSGTLGRFLPHTNQEVCRVFHSHRVGILHRVPTRNNNLENKSNASHYLYNLLSMFHPCQI